MLAFLVNRANEALWFDAVVDNTARLGTILLPTRELCDERIGNALLTLASPMSRLTCRRLNCF